MLVLSRRSEESVIVDGLNGSTREIKVTVLQVKGGSVQLGFEVNTDAPRRRSESRERIRGGLGHGRSTAGPESLLRGVFNDSEKPKDRQADWGRARSTKVADYRGSEQEVKM